MAKKIRLIDADALQDAFYDECEGECYYCDYHLTEGIQEGRLYECGLINKAPTILLLNDRRVNDGQEN